MEPLFVDNDFGRGFDSRRLHHSSLQFWFIEYCDDHEAAGLVMGRFTLV